MMLTRRAMLGGAAAIAAASTVQTTPARAAAPMIGKQGPSFYRYKIGDFEVTALNEGMVRNATPGEHGGQQDPAGRAEGARRRVPADRPRHQSVQHPGGEHRAGTWC